MGVGYVIGTFEPRVLVRVGAQIGRGTNNEAEYQALLAGMRHALKLGLWNMAVSSDSALVVNQFHARWRVKDARLKRLREEAVLLSRLFQGFSLDHVYREENQDADDLSRKLVFEEPDLGPLPSHPRTGKAKSFHPWQAAAIRVWHQRHHPGTGVLGRIFGVPSSQIEQIAYGETYRDADFSTYPWAQPCPECLGTKSVTKSYGQGEFGDLYQEPCDACMGTGRKA